jgi:RNA polymerase sigma factor (sigma-70 family)
MRLPITDFLRCGRRKKISGFKVVAAAYQLNMSEWHADFELLQAFSRKGDQPAFATLTRRHLDLVYATALRKVTDGGGAEEICQNVFGALARKAWQFAPDDSLPSWLHRTTLLESKSWLRGELRRRRREEAAAELGTTMNTPEEQPAFHALVPLLDEALLSLREKDRTSLLLRFYESQSLRDVGAAAGLSEDAARKRVRSALEKLTEFFKRRGFKTATVAAAAAALQHTAATTSAAVDSSVVNAALQIAPPALVGLGAVLARLASLSRVQTTVVCLALVVVPVGWQLNQRAAAATGAGRMQAQLLAAQRETAAAQSELERTQATFGRLQQTVAQRKEAADRAAESARAFELWKQKTRSQLLAEDYRWDDDSAFMRISKALLPQLTELIQSNPISPPGVVNPFIRELLGLTSAERQTLEATLQRIAELQHGETADIYERDLPSTDLPSTGRVIALRGFADEPSGQTGAEAEQRFARMLSDIRGIVGEERWAVLPTRLRSVNCEDLNSMLIPAPRNAMEVSVSIDDQGTPKVHWDGSFGVSGPSIWNANRTRAMKGISIGGWGNAPLSDFLPGGLTNQAKGCVSGLPEPMRKYVSAWLQEQAAARLGGKEKP